MATFKNVETANTLEVTTQKGEAKVEVDMGKLSPEILAKLAEHGLRQKIADAAAGAKKMAEEDGAEVVPTAQALMEKVKDRLEAGEWGAERGGASTADPMDKYRIEVLRAMIKAQPDGKLAKAYSEIGSDDQKARREFLLGIAEKNAEKIEPMAEERKAEADRKRQAAKSAAEGLDL